MSSEATRPDPVAAPPPADSPRERRRIRNYLLDAPTQLRYTALLVSVAGVLTAGLGLTVFEKSRQAARAMRATVLSDPALAAQLEREFASADRSLMLALFAFGVLLLVVLALVGIVFTHRIAGPIYKTAGYLRQIAGGRLGRPAPLRKGDQLGPFYESFLAAHATLRAGAERDLADVEAALVACEGEALRADAPELAKAVATLRELAQRKREELA